MIEVSTEEVKSQLELLLRKVSGGGEVLVTEGGEPVARIVPYTPKKRGMLGLLRGQIQISKDFDDPLPREILEVFER